MVSNQPYSGYCTNIGRLFVRPRGGLTGSALDHRSLPPAFESRRGHIWRVFHLRLRFVTVGGRSAHLAYRVTESGRKTSIIIIIIIFILAYLISFVNMSPVRFSLFLHIRKGDNFCRLFHLSFRLIIFGFSLWGAQTWDVKHPWSSSLSSSSSSLVSRTSIICPRCEQLNNSTTTSPWCILNE